MAANISATGSVPEMICQYSELKLNAVVSVTVVSSISIGPISG